MENIFHLREDTLLQSLIIVGGGPGALAPLFAAASNGTLRTLLATGVAVIERSSEPGAGQLSTITIKSDSPAEAFLDILKRSQEPSLRELLNHPTVHDIRLRQGSSIPLRMAADLIRLASQKILEIVASHPNCTVHTDTEVQFIQRLRSGFWKVVCKDRCGSTKELHGISVHLATGAHQPLERLATERVAGAPLLPRYESKVIQSGELFTAAGAAQLRKKLSGIPSPKVVIIGGSTSAGAAATYLLRHPEVSFQGGEVVLLHRNPLRFFYQSTEEAHQDGYSGFSESDVCTLTGRVFRLSGLRFESKELLRDSLRGNAGATDRRLTLFPMAGRDHEAQEYLERADIIIAALGYIPRMCDIRDEYGDSIPLRTPTRHEWSMVDHTCTVVTHEEERLDGVTAMGLAIGPKASPELGGEARFTGQVNSLWLWQNRLGERVVESAIRRSRQRIPLMRPAPPPLSQHSDRFLAIESSNIYSNFGSENTLFEQSLLQSFFHGNGACLTTCNATLALMLAIKNAAGDLPSGKRYALMPSFTFAAAAQAALWCGLTPLFCDISPHTWLPCYDSERSLLQLFGNQIAVIVPNATFGNNLDLLRYEALQRETGIPVVVDAAASLGSLNHEAFHSEQDQTCLLSFQCMQPRASLRAKAA